MAQNGSFLKACIVCGKPFTCRPANKERAKFCSCQCKADFQRGKDPYNKGNITWSHLACEHCGKEFKLPFKQVQKFCSLKCRTAHWIGSGSPSWKGGRRARKDGYMLIKVLPGKGGEVLEHRFVMERHLGRPLQPNEHVHHINGDKTDNRIENLLVLSCSEHTRLHSELKKEKPDHAVL